MNGHFEFNHHTKIASASTQCPKQVRVFLPIRADDRSVRNNHNKAPHVVTKEAVQTIQPSGPTSENQATRADIGNHTYRKCKLHLLRCRINHTKQASTLESHSAVILVNLNPAHERKINHQSAVAKTKASKTITPATNCGHHTC